MHQRARDALAAVRAELLEIDPDLANDPQLMLDTLDGESDGIDIIRRIIRASIDADLESKAADAAKEVYQNKITDLRARAARFEKRKDKLRTVAAALMSEAGIKSLPEPDFTAGFSNGQQWFVGEPDVAKLPDEYLEYLDPKVKTQELLAAAREGKEIAGAPALSNAQPVFWVRAR